MARKPKNNTVTAKGNETATTRNSVNENKVAEDVNVVKANEKEVKDTVKKDNDSKVETASVSKTDPKTAEIKKSERTPAANKTEEKTQVQKEEAADTNKRGRKPGSTNKKKEQLVPEVYLQYCGEESDQGAIIEKIKEQYVAEGHRAGNIKSLKLYLKPEDRAAYYVINDRYAGKVDLFNY